MPLSLYFKLLMIKIACVDTISTWSCLLPSVSFIYLLYRCPQVVHYKQYWELRCGDNIIMNVTEACFGTVTHLHWSFLEIVFWAWFIYLLYTEQHCHKLRLQRVKLWDGYLIWKFVEGRSYALISDTIIPFAWQDWEKPHKPSSAKIQTWDLPNANRSAIQSAARYNLNMLHNKLNVDIWA